MRYLWFGTLLVLALVFAPGTILAQVESGPSAGSKLEALKVVTATGDNAGKEADYAKERKDKPTIFVFVQADKWDRPTARFLRALDEALVKDHKDVQVIAVWLTDDVAKAKEYLPKAQESLKLSQTTFAVHPGEKSGPAGWGINADAHVTAVVAQDQKVTASFGFGSLNETDAPAVLKKIKAAADEPAREKKEPGWPDSFVKLGGYSLTLDKPIVGEGEKPSTYQQKGTYLWTGGRAEVLEVTLARDPAFKDRYSADALKKEDPQPKELEINKKKAWLWEFARDGAKFDQVSHRLVILLDADKAIIIEQKGNGANLETVAKKFDFAEIEKALANPPKR
jgi:hypothetical protein